MKTDNLNVPGEFSHAKVRGHIGRRAGTPGPTIYDAGGNDVTSSDITILGAGVSGDTEMAYVTIRGTGDSLTNNSGAALIYGQVVVLDDDGTIVTTTTPQDPRPVGVVQVGGNDGQPVIVAFSGFVSRVNCTASVTAGNYGETSSTVGAATEHSTLREGSFCQFLETSATPSAYLFGSPTTSPSISAGDFVTTTLGGQEHVSTVAVSGSSQTLDLADANDFDITLSDDCDIDTTGWVAGVLCSIVVDLTLAGFTPTFTDTPYWLGSDGVPTTTPPTFPSDADAVARVVLSSKDGGSTIWATYVGSGGATTRWELATISGSPPDNLYADGDWLYIEVPI